MDSFYDFHSGTLSHGRSSIELRLLFILCSHLPLFQKTYNISKLLDTKCLVLPVVVSSSSYDGGAKLDLLLLCMTVLDNTVYLSTHVDIPGPIEDAYFSNHPCLHSDIDTCMQ